MIKEIIEELKRHTPFTAFGALTGILIMVLISWKGLIPQFSLIASDIFYVLHPTHVVLSALVTTALYRKYRNANLFMAILIGYTGSIGIATLSDSIFPFMGETLLDLPNRGIHIGFIEEWWIVNPAALLGIMIGYFKQSTRVSHYGHVMISTWASTFHVIMALGETVSWIQISLIFLFLFLAVWIPCCMSDIVYPLIFARGQKESSSKDSGGDIASANRHSY
ncbi:MAG: hypothetical protein SVM80_10155 [Halobacteriota archaeon]|nr:hypothetical protein [Halobacteriota archaeon]